jgi:hypothetical protein
MRKHGYKPSLGLILPATDEQTAEYIAGEVLVELRDGPVLRVAAMAWRPGEDGEAVIARARLATGYSEKFGLERYYLGPNVSFFRAEQREGVLRLPPLIGRASGIEE